MRAKNLQVSFLLQDPRDSFCLCQTPTFRRPQTCLLPPAHHVARSSLGSPSCHWCPCCLHSQPGGRVLFFQCPVACKGDFLLTQRPGESEAGLEKESSLYTPRIRASEILISRTRWTSLPTLAVLLISSATLGKLLTHSFSTWFFLCEMGIRTVPTPLGCGEDEMR